MPRTEQDKQHRTSLSNIRRAKSSSSCRGTAHSDKLFQSPTHGDKVFRTYFINNRGDEHMGSTWNYLDLTALGRQEEWEDSPEGYPQTPPYEWWIWHDQYAEHTPWRWFGDPDPDDPNDQRPPRKDA